jgi:hypothetical protein
MRVGLGNGPAASLASVAVSTLHGTNHDAAAPSHGALRALQWNADSDGACQQLPGPPPSDHLGPACQSAIPAKMIQPEPENNPARRAPRDSATYPSGPSTDSLITHPGVSAIWAHLASGRAGPRSRTTLTPTDRAALHSKRTKTGRTSSGPLPHNSNGCRCHLTYFG